MYVDEACLVVWDSRQKDLEILRDIGCKGASPLQDITGYRCVCCDLCILQKRPAPPVCALIVCAVRALCTWLAGMTPFSSTLWRMLYGVVRDFWKLMLRKPGDTVDLGDHIRVSTAAQEEIQELFATLKITFVQQLCLGHHQVRCMRRSSILSVACIRRDARLVCCR